MLLKFAALLVQSDLVLICFVPVESLGAFYHQSNHQHPQLHNLFSTKSFGFHDVPHEMFLHHSLAMLFGKAMESLGEKLLQEEVD